MPSAVKAFLSSYQPSVQKLALAVRKLILDVFPGACERIDTGSKLIGYGVGEKMSDLICVIMPLKAGVNLGLYRGTELPDPEKLLTGTGKLHRHVRIESAADVESRALRALLGAAVAAKKKRTPPGL